MTDKLSPHSIVFEGVFDQFGMPFKPYHPEDGQQVAVWEVKPATRSKEIVEAEQTVAPAGTTLKEYVELQVRIYSNLLRQQWIYALFFLVTIILAIVLQHTDWEYMDHKQWYYIWCIVVCMGLISLRIATPDVLLWLAITLMILHNDTIELKKYYFGLGDESVVTYSLLLTIFAAMEYVGLFKHIMHLYFVPIRNRYLAQLQVLLFGMGFAAFFDSYTVLHRMVPVVREWANRSNLPLSQVMLPLAYIMQVGGCLTMVGSLQIMLVRGLSISALKTTVFEFFEVGNIAIVLCGIVLLYTWILTPWMFANNKDGKGDDAKDLREYTVSVIVKKSAQMVGKTVEAAGLRHLPGIFLIEIERSKGEVIPAPSSETFINAGDKLTFAGDIDNVQTIWRTRGFAPTFIPVMKEQEEKGNLAETLMNPTRKVIAEVVIASHSPVAGMTVKEAEFRARYGAAIIAVHRFGHRIVGNFGDIVITPGDTYLLETTNKFLDKYKEHSHFALVSEISESVKIDSNKVKMILVLGAIVTLFTFMADERYTYGTNALGCVYFLMFVQCLPLATFRGAFRGSVLLEMAAAFTINYILKTYTITTDVGIAFVEHFESAWGLLWAIYLFSSVLCYFIGPAATIAMMWTPISRICKITKYDIRSFAYALAFATSTSFGSPDFVDINMIVAGPGGYSKWDYVRFGIPLQLLCSAVIVPMIHELYVFRSP